MEKVKRKNNINQSAFKDLLRSTLMQRCKANESYSLRAFARDLNVEASALSKIIRGERALSPQMFDRFCSSLNLSPKEQADFIETDEAEFQQITEDCFKVIADWYHYAILELTHLQSFKADEKWICEKLGITKTETRKAIERLKRLNLLKVDENGKWIDTGENLSTVSVKHTNQAYKNLQTGVLEKAILALNEIPFDQRDQSSMTLAFSKSEMPKAKELLKKYRRQFVNQMEDYETADQVYHLSFSLYPLLKKKNTEEI